MHKNTDPILLYNTIIRQLVRRPEGYNGTSVHTGALPRKVNKIEAARTLATYPLCLHHSAFEVPSDNDATNCLSALAWLFRNASSDRYIIGAITRVGGGGVQSMVNLIIVGEEEEKRRVLEFLYGLLKLSFDDLSEEEIRTAVANYTIIPGRRRMLTYPMDASLKAKLEQLDLSQHDENVRGFIGALLQWEDLQLVPTPSNIMRFYALHSKHSDVKLTRLERLGVLNESEGKSSLGFRGQHELNRSLFVVEELLAWYSEKYMQTMVAVDTLQMQTLAMVNSDPDDSEETFLKILRGCCNSGDFVMYISPNQDICRLLTSTWNLEDWRDALLPLYAEEDAEQLEADWPNIRPTRGEYIRSLVNSCQLSLDNPDDTPEQRISHTPSQLLLTLYEWLTKLHESESADDRDNFYHQIIIATSFRPCLGCALFARACDKIFYGNSGLRGVIYFPPPNPKDTSIWLMPTLQNTEQRDLFRGAFLSACEHELQEWAAAERNGEILRRNKREREARRRGVWA